MRRPVLVALAFACLAATIDPPPAAAGKFVQFGIQDDAWIAFGPGGTIDDRLTLLRRIGVRVVRFTLEWNRIAAKRPRHGRDPGDPAYEWGAADAVLKGIRDHGMIPLVTIYGSPRWANGGKPPSHPPRSKWAFAGFAFAAAKRYPFVRRWTIWNEPNQLARLNPPSPRLYVKRLLNPAYTAIKKANRRALVGGGVTAPRGQARGVSPIAWIVGMGKAKAKLDAYAHNPYPLNPKRETPFTGGCRHCTTATMAEMERLLTAVRRNLGRKRIWLTEYGYQTNPPDRALGVSWGLQARYVGEAGLRAWQLPFVDILIHYLFRDDVVNSPTAAGYWQSGLETASGRRKPSFRAFMLPLAQVSRKRARTVVWGQVRPRSGRQRFILQRRVGRKWVATGARRITGKGGMFLRVVRAGRGTKLRIWSPRDRVASPVLVVR